MQSERERKDFRRNWKPYLKQETREKPLLLFKRLGRSVNRAMGKQEKDAILNRHQKNMILQFDWLSHYPIIQCHISTWFCINNFGPHLLFLIEVSASCLNFVRQYFTHFNVQAEIANFNFFNVKSSYMVSLKSNETVHILRCDRHCPEWVLATEPDNQSASL